MWMVMRVTFACAGLTAMSSGLSCRETSLPVGVESRKIGVHYDTAYEDRLKNSDKPLPKLLEGVWDPYFETLDEPVAILSSRPEGMTWEVFFATNRQPHISEAAAPIAFSNQLSPSLTFGRSEIQIPQRRRGVSPESVKSKSPPEDVSSPFLRQLKDVGEGPFLAGVRSQVERSRQRDLLLFVHGFNVGFEAALVRTAQLALDLPFNGAVVSYAWPSQGGLSNYRADEAVNQDSIAPFHQFLQSLRAGLPKDTKIHLVVHSMGNRLVLAALQQPTGKGEDSQPWLKNLVLCAPDVGLADYRQWLPQVAAQTERITLYASRGDAALVASKVLHREQRIGEANPVICEAGVEAIDCSGIDFSFLGHSYYGSNIDVLGDLFELIKLDRPAAKRAHLQQISDDSPSWRFARLPHTILWSWNFEE